MQTWDLKQLKVEPHHPQVLLSQDEGRAIAIHLPKGEQLQEHQTHERSWLIVADGEIQIDDTTGETIKGGPGLMAEFAPNERREVTATEDARLLLILSPWPGDGHPSQEKSG